MESYKIDLEKCFKLLRCISPPIIFINGPWAIGKNVLVDKFKKEGYSILTLGNKTVEEVQKFLKSRKQRFDHTSLIIEANFSNTDSKIISEIFSDDFHNFTYVFVYPNNAKKYKEKISEKLSEEISEKSKHSGMLNSILEMKKQKENPVKIENSTNKLTMSLISEAKKIYQEHLEIFDYKILTVLV